MLNESNIKVITSTDIIALVITLSNDRLPVIASIDLIIILDKQIIPMKKATSKHAN